MTGTNKSRGIYDTRNRSADPVQSRRTFLDYAFATAFAALTLYIASQSYDRVIRDSIVPGDDLVGHQIPAVLRDTNAEVIVLVTPSCPYCRASVPAWNQLMANGRHVVGLSPGGALRFKKLTDAQFPVIDIGYDVFSELGISGVPQTLLIDDDVVQAIHTGLLAAPEILDRDTAFLRWEYALMLTACLSLVALGTTLYVWRTKYWGLGRRAARESRALKRKGKRTTSCAALSLAALMFLQAGCGPRFISAGDAWQAIRSGESLLIDLRPDVQYPGMAIGALHAPLTELPQRIAPVRTDVPLILYSLSSNDDAIGDAHEFLTQRGHRDISVLSGGIQRWYEEGLRTSGIQFRRGPTPWKALSQVLEEYSLPSVSQLLLLYPEGLRTTEDFFRDLRAKQVDLAIPTAFVAFSAEGQPSVHTENSIRADEDLRLMAEAIARAYQEASSHVVHGPSAFGFSPSGERFVSLLPRTSDIEALLYLLGLPEEALSPAEIAKETVQEIYYAATDRKVPSGGALALFTSVCGDCPSAAILVGLNSTAQLAGRPAHILIPMSMMGADRRVWSTHELVEVVPYDDFDRHVQRLLSRLSLMNVLIPLVFEVPEEPPMSNSQGLRTR